MKKIFFLTSILGIILSSVLVFCIAFSKKEISFPKTISVKQELTKPEEFWEVFFDDMPNHLMAITIFDGHPKDRASLIPDVETNEDGTTVSIWRLTPNKTQKYWIGCSYDRTNIVLIRPLDSEISICRVKYDTTITISGHPSISKIEFK